MTHADRLKFARQMRRQPTPAEAALWARLTGKALGVRFIRQAVLSGWILDFYCPAARLVIELDGSSHDTAEAVERDRLRDRSLEKRRLKILRFRNRQVFFQLNATVSQIRKSITNGLRGLGLQNVSPSDLRSRVADFNNGEKRVEKGQG